MLKARLQDVRTILCIGAHADDIEIGCGGTILRMLAAQEVEVHWVVLGATAERAAEADRSARRFLEGAVDRRIIVESFPDGFFPGEWKAIKEYLHELEGKISPDLIFTHRREDAHQDHRVVSELTWSVFRDHLIVEYEIPKYDGDLGRANLLVTLTEETCRAKVDNLVEVFETQRTKPWFAEETFWALLRLRGVEAKSPSALAEGFYCRKMVL